MKDELRIAVAEALGWRITDLTEEIGDSWSVGPPPSLDRPANRFRLMHGKKMIISFEWTHFGGRLPLRPSLKDCLSSLPELSLDLFAEIRKGMTPAERDEYLEFLMDSIGEDHGSWEIMLGLLDATVEQHAQAFLRVRGLWKE